MCRWAGQRGSMKSPLAVVLSRNVSNIARYRKPAVPRRTTSRCFLIAAVMSSSVFGCMLAVSMQPRR
jgi:hypothetical protein